VRDICCCEGRAYNKTLLRQLIFVSRESTLTVEGSMAKGGSKQRAAQGKLALAPANDDALPDEGFPSNTAANDNPPIEDLPTCLAVTDDEVRLLRQYLGQEILALFG
jgi:hypothetical protein